MSSRAERGICFWDEGQMKQIPRCARNDSGGTFISFGGPKAQVNTQHGRHLFFHQLAGCNNIRELLQPPLARRLQQSNRHNRRSWYG